RPRLQARPGPRRVRRRNPPRGRHPRPPLPPRPSRPCQRGSPDAVRAVAYTGALMSIESDNLETVRRYFAALERGAGSDEMATFFAPDVVQIEFPNRFMVNGAQRDLAQLREAAERGRKAVESQRFEVRNALASGHQVALEVEWTATLKVP